MTFKLDADRLSRSRFVLSRLVELTCGLEILAHPERAPYARRWVDQTRRRVDLSAVAALFALADHGSWYVPDFVVPIPATYEPDLEEELAAVAAVPPALVRSQLEMAFRLGSPPALALRRSRAHPGSDPRWPLPPVLADLLAKGGEAALIECVTDQLRRCWQLLMAETWPAVRRLLDEDVRHRAAQASRVGFGEIVGQVSPKMRWDGTEVALDHPYDVQVEATPGLVMTPSVFLSRPAVWLGPPGQVMVGYPARGRAQVWSSSEPGDDEASILGARRAGLLADLDTPRSTTELAERHRLSPSTVSYHLARLRHAGLVHSRRAGHSVVYQHTPLAVELLAALNAGR